MKRFLTLCALCLTFYTYAQDVTPPVISDCPDNTWTPVEIGRCDAVVTWSVPTATDDLKMDTLYADYAPGDTFSLGITTVTYTAVDSAGNVSTCMFDVEVEDIYAPVITGCPGEIVLSADSASCEAVATWTAPEAMDNCSSVNLTATHAPGDNFALGITTVTYTAVDTLGNISACSFVVKVEDNLFPTIVNCPNDTTIVAEADSCSAVYTWIAPTAADNCGVVDFRSSDSSGTRFSVGETVVTFEARDAANNLTTCSFTITVVDAEKPAIMGCPQDTTMLADIVGCSTNFIWTAPTASDNCGIAEFEGSHASGDVFYAGTTVVSYTAVDNSGNDSVCAFTVTIVDDEAPVISGCLDTIVVAALEDTCVGLAFWSDPDMSDDCSVDSVYQSALSGDTFALGLTEVVYRIFDTAGNSDTCSFYVRVIDEEEPVFEDCPEDMEVSAQAQACFQVVSWNEPTVWDNCNAVLVTQTHAPLDTFYMGETVVEYTAVDSAGNEEFCSFVVTVVDETAPQVSDCPNDTLIELSTDSCSMVINWTIPTFTDNCGLDTVIASHASGMRLEAGYTDVEYTAYDAFENEATCSFVIELRDTIRPLLNCWGDTTVYLGDSSCFALIDFMEMEVLENCEVEGMIVEVNEEEADSIFEVGVYEVDVVVYDKSENEDGCSFVLTVSDSTAPVFNCPDDVFVSADIDDCGTIVEWKFDVTDNCSIDSLTKTYESGDWFEIGTTEILYEAYDPSGNMGTCSFTITVIDSIYPVVACPENITSCDSIVEFDPITAEDNCDSVSIVRLDSTGLSSGDVFPLGTSVLSYAISDASGNADTCSFEVTRIDHIYAGMDSTFVICWNNIDSTMDFDLRSYLGEGVSEGGYWRDLDNTGALEGDTFKFNKLFHLPGDYEFRYIIAPNGCSDQDAAMITARIQLCSGVEEYALEAWSMYPNPASMFITLGYAGSQEEVSVELIDNLGRIVLQTQHFPNQTLNVSDLEQGIYQVRIVREGVLVYTNRLEVLR